MDIYTFDKSYSERLTEYLNILFNRKDITPSSQIRADWAYHIELTIEPVGWKALWKIPRLTCQEFNIHYPTIVAVEVENTDFAELSALVKIVAVQDDIHLPEKYDVPLIELYPTKEQENTALDIAATAECIDQLQFFYNYLWMPWDMDDDETSDWVSNHLEARLKLFFDMKRGIVCKKTSEVIRTLMREGRDIQEKIDKLGLDISDDEDDQDKAIAEGKSKTLCQLMKLHLRFQQIKAEMEVLENPKMRDMLIKTQSKEPEKKKRESRGPRMDAHFVWLGGTLQDTLSAMKTLQGFLPLNIFMKTSSSLQEAFSIANRSDVVAIGEGEHPIKSCGNLEEGGTIRGIGMVEKTIICPQETESGPCLLDFSGEEVSVENVTIDVRDLQAGILVRKGLLKLMNCRIMVFNQSVIKLGIVVLPGAKLVAINCRFVGLGTSIVIKRSAEVVVNGCGFEDCIEGIQLDYRGRFLANNCSFSNCKEYAIRKETADLNVSQAGDIGILKNETEIVIQTCTFENNIKGDVHLRSCSNMIIPQQENMIIS